MKKRSILFGLMLTFSCYGNAFAYTDEAQQKWKDGCDSVGGFIYNTVPWNWDNWMRFPWEKPKEQDYKSGTLTTDHF